MFNKKNEKQENIIRDAEECFRSFGLTPYKRGDQKKMAVTDEVILTSEISNDKVYADVILFNRKKTGTLMLDVLLNNITLRPETLAQTRRLLNLLNRDRTLFHYSTCQYCDCVSLRAILFLSGGRVPTDKFKRLIGSILKDTYHVFRVIAAVINHGNSDILYPWFLYACQEIMVAESAISEKDMKTIGNEIEAIYANVGKLDFGTPQELRARLLLFTRCDSESIDFSPGISIWINGMEACVNVAVVLSPSIPDEKTALMTELVDLVNKNIGLGHVFLNLHTMKVHLVLGMMIENTILDKTEFDTAFRGLLSHLYRLLPMVGERLVSNECSEALFEKWWLRQTQSAVNTR